MRKIEIKIKQEVIDYLQRLHFEVESRKDIIQRIIEAHAYDENTDILDSRVFKKYDRELSELKAEYELAKLEVTKEYVPDEFKETNIIWNIDFQTAVMTIEVDNAKG